MGKLDTVKKSQVKRFREAARELGGDEREETFDAALKRIAKAPPQHKRKKSPKTARRRGRE